MVANSARDAASFAAAPVGAARADGSGGTIVVRADSAYYFAASCRRVRRARRRFSVTVKMDSKIAAVIAPRWLGVSGGLTVAGVGAAAAPVGLG